MKIFTSVHSGHQSSNSADSLKKLFCSSRIVSISLSAKRSAALTSWSPTLSICSLVASESSGFVKALKAAACCLLLLKMTLMRKPKQ